MIAYQPETLNTLDPYCGPQGYGMQSGSIQTIDNITTVGLNQIDPIIRPGKIGRPTRSFEGLSEEMEMRPKGSTGRATIPGSGTPSARPSSSGSLPGSGTPSPRSAQIMAAQSQGFAPIAPILPGVPATVQVTPVVIETTPAKPWYKSPLYLTILAGGIFFMAKKYKFI